MTMTYVCTKEIHPLSKVCKKEKERIMNYAQDYQGNEG